MHAKPCCRIVAFLADYLEGQLPANVQADLDAHLRACSRCGVELKTYESTLSLLRSLTDDDLPPDLRLTVRSFLNTRWQNN